MGIDCYYNPLSNPCRSVLMAAKNLEIPMTLKLVDIFAGDQMKPEFIKVSLANSCTFNKVAKMSQ